MPVITITITDSPIQIVKGIPQTISVSTNIPSTIFFTLDGTDPDISSDVMVGSLKLPTSSSLVVLKLFATDGVNNSSIIEKIYKNDTFYLNRQPRDKVIGLDINPLPGQDLYPFGTLSPQTNVRYGNTAGIVVDGSNVEGIPDGYDGTGTNTIAAETDKKLTEYDFVYSIRDRDGNNRFNIGKLPAKTRVRISPTPPTTSNEGSVLFNPKAVIIIQDGRDEPFNPEIVNLNRSAFSLTNNEKFKDGINFYNSAMDGNIPTGYLLRQQYNPREQTMTYYYFDSQALRWIISKEPYSGKNNKVTSLTNVVFSPRDKGVGKVFRWIPFKRSHLR